MAGWVSEHLPDRFLVAQSLEACFVPSKKPVVRVQFDGARKMSDRCRPVSGRRPCDGEHVLDLLAVWCFNERGFEML